MARKAISIGKFVYAPQQEKVKKEERVKWKEESA